MKNLKTQGFILLDVDVVALNNAGAKKTTLYDNAVITKSIFKNGRSYVYVSGQAWRYWWREALQKNLGWNMSPIIRETKTAFTAVDPISFPDDDVFGYMKAPKGSKETVTRVSPLKNSAIISAASVNPVENWSSMARQEGDSVPYSKQEYSAIMKGMFSLDLVQVGTFSNYNKTGFVNLSEKLRKEAIEKGAIEIDDPFVKSSDGKPAKLIRLDKETRRKRILDIIQALKYISGGAMQTNNLGDVTPKFIILATTTTGNHPFSHIVKNTGKNDEIAQLNLEGLREVLSDYKSTFEGKVFIGKRSGFFDEENKSLEELKNLGFVEFTSVNDAIDKYCEQLKNQIE